MPNWPRLCVLSYIREWPLSASITLYQRWSTCIGLTVHRFSLELRCIRKWDKIIILNIIYVVYIEHTYILQLVSIYTCMWNAFNLLQCCPKPNRLTSNTKMVFQYITFYFVSLSTHFAIQQHVCILMYTSIAFVHKHSDAAPFTLHTHNQS